MDQSVQEWGDCPVDGMKQSGDGESRSGLPGEPGGVGLEQTGNAEDLMCVLSSAAPPEQFQAALLLALPNPSAHIQNVDSNTKDNSGKVNLT